MGRTTFSEVRLGDISRYRGEMMGLAMLFVILFHVALSRDNPFYGLRRCGNVGVDLFLFLSGVGLWHGWVRRPDVWAFYRRRMLRLLPAWLICATAFYLPDWLGAQRYSRSLPDLLGDITVNLDFWLHDELTFWYVPAIMMLYLWAPWYMRLIERHPVFRWLPVLMVVWCVMVQRVVPLHHAVGHLEIFWSRVPIFFIGINMGEQVRSGRTLEPQSLWLFALVAAVTGGTCVYLEQYRHGLFPLYEERMLYIPLTVSLSVLLCKALGRVPGGVRRMLCAVGALSLEAYLIHLHFVYVHVQPLAIGYWPAFLLTVAATLPAAWLLHAIVGRMMPGGKRAGGTQGEGGR